MYISLLYALDYLRLIILKHLNPEHNLLTQDCTTKKTRRHIRDIRFAIEIRNTRFEIQNAIFEITSQLIDLEIGILATQTILNRYHLDMLLYTYKIINVILSL